MMLVTFTCDAYENVVFFGDVALRLLTIMGHSGTVPSAILAADVPAALLRLQRAVEQSSVQDNTNNHDVSLRHRALPLIHLLQAAAKQHCDVLWK